MTRIRGDDPIAIGLEPGLLFGVSPRIVRMADSGEKPED